MVQVVLMLHVLFGVLAIMIAVAVLVYLVNVKEQNIPRIKNLSILVALSTILSYLIGGYWYVTYYTPERDIIKAGPWPWAHTFFMEAKEHIFFVLLFLSIYLPIVVYKDSLLKSEENRKLALIVVVFIILIGLAVDGSGAIISRGLIMSLLGR
ncbi:MAG: hypothetical protein NT072_10165 [Deltaproteobacteria bacterium]|nr:hypothetical protein [Deltaproteobacteria bacterium]